MTCVNVHHQTGTYNVEIGIGILGDRRLRDVTGKRPALIVTDATIAPLWLARLQSSLPKAETLVLPAGETAKSFDTVQRIWSFLAENHFGRDTVLIALGGGVVGDMTGYAAACWMRGIDFIQVPTTLLAQVDASIGGKTGVNLPAGKNLVGAFHQPLAVFADTDTLQTLPEREYCAGMAEIVKAALLADEEFFTWMEANADRLRARDSENLVHAICRACEIKAAIVIADEKERGRRALLNLGHTFGHALESVTNYERFLHGEAVAVGLVLAAIVSEQQCGLDPGLRPRLETLLAAFGLPVRLPADVNHDSLLEVMRLDKKHTQAAWRLILLNALGEAVVEEFKDETAVRRALASSRTQAPW